MSFQASVLRKLSCVQKNHSLLWFEWHKDREKLQSVDALGLPCHWAEKSGELCLQGPIPRVELGALPSRGWHSGSRILSLHMHCFLEYSKRYQNVVYFGTVNTTNVTITVAMTSRTVAISRYKHFSFSHLLLIITYLLMLVVLWIRNTLHRYPDGGASLRNSGNSRRGFFDAGSGSVCVSFTGIPPPFLSSPCLCWRENFSPSCSWCHIYCHNAWSQLVMGWARRTLFLMLLTL